MPPKDPLPGVGSGSATVVQQAPPEDNKVETTKSTSSSEKKTEDPKALARAAQGSKQNATEQKSQQNMQAQIVQEKLQKQIPHTPQIDVLLSSIDSDEVGEKMAHRLTNKSIKPEQIDDVMNKVPTSDRRAVAFAFTKELTNGQLKDLAASVQGETTLKKMQDHLTTGDPDKKYDQGMGPDDHDQADRIGTALVHKKLIANATTNLEKSEDFSKLSETTRTRMLAALERNSTNPKIADEIKQKSHSVKYLNRPEDVRNKIVNEMYDQNFSDALKNLAGKESFKNLGETAQAKVIKDLTKFSETKSYTKMNPADGGKALEIISALSIDAEEKNSKSPTARNTVKHLVDGSVPMELMNKPDTSIAGEAKVFTMQFNTGNTDLLSDTDNLVTTAAHEVNHIVNGRLNGQTNPGTVERFLDEYRAYYMEDSAIDMRQADSIKLQEKITDLTSGDPAYAHLHRLYKDNSQFKGIVDEMSKGLNGRPPRITTPEELRLKLKAIPGTNSEYLNRAGNIDNH